jgi:hypothetical protein
VDTTQKLSNGTHDLMFRLWDANGNVYTAQKSITVNGETAQRERAVRARPIFKQK